MYRKEGTIRGSCILLYLPKASTLMTLLAKNKQREGAMATIKNQITIEAPTKSIWAILTDLEALEQYDPTVKSVRRISENTAGIGAARRVTMRDGKNWFEEKITELKENQVLTYTLTDCSFPLANLNHRYTFDTDGKSTTVRQIMSYTVKFGILGKFLDLVMIRPQSDKGIKKFFAGLKAHAEGK